MNDTNFNLRIDILKKTCIVKFNIIFFILVIYLKKIKKIYF